VAISIASRMTEGIQYMNRLLWRCGCDWGVSWVCLLQGKGSSQASSSECVLVDLVLFIHSNNSF